MADSAAHSDDELVLQAQAGDIKAMEALFERDHTSILLYLARLLDEEHAGPLTLLTFRSAWEALPGLKASAEYRSWLYRIATNIAYDTRFQGPGRRPWPFVNAVATRSASREDDSIESALRRLAFYERASLALHIVAGFTLDQIASCLGLSSRRINTHLDNAFRQIMRDPAVSTSDRNAVTRQIQALPTPNIRLTSPFALEETTNEGSTLSLRHLSSSTSYTRPPRQRMLLRHTLTLTSSLLIVTLVASSLLLLLANRGQLIGPIALNQPTPTPNIYDARIDRPTCFFVNPANDDSNGGSICNSYLYSNVNQQRQARSGYSIQIQQVYIDDNAVALAYTLLGPANSTLDVSVDLDAALTIQETHTSLPIGRKYAASSTFFGQRNAISDASFYYLPASTPPTNATGLLHMTLDIHSLWLTNQSSGKVSFIYQNSTTPLRFQFSSRYSEGENITPLSSTATDLYVVKQAIVTTSMTRITLTCRTANFCQQARSIRLSAGHSTYLPSDTFFKGKLVDIYYHASTFDKPGRWYLTFPQATKEPPIYLNRAE